MQALGGLHRSTHAGVGMPPSAPSKQSRSVRTRFPPMNGAVAASLVSWRDARASL